eukprot:TRINITY_DN26460_c0_g1_i2.p1 TRINITY_DN26460_c0_g1~~TRINITY_DN26460_c0_g1_i2.p1  ORF type:complete len:288 (+),score=39.63 TRINITY_DN26460_c0_g1_i2:161-1024(+)
MCIRDRSSGMQSVRLSNGTLLPQYGLGLSHNGGFNPDAVTASLDAGVRLFDTAARYRTEQPLAMALSQDKAVDRADLWITTKLWPGDAHDPGEALRRSLGELGMEYVDMYLVHWPGSWSGAESAEQAKSRRQRIWREMEKILESGRARSIGVSNFMPHHLQDLAESATVMPMVNQIEFNPFQQAKHVRAACHQLDIVCQGYSPLAKAHCLNHPAVCRIADSLGATAAQVLIRWSLQSGVPVIPKTTRPERVLENIGSLDIELNSAQMSVLDGLDSNMRVTWDPTQVP